MLLTYRTQTIKLFATLTQVLISLNSLVLSANAIPTKKEVEDHASKLALKAATKFCENKELYDTKSKFIDFASRLKFLNNEEKEKVYIFLEDLSDAQKKTYYDTYTLTLHLTLFAAKNGDLVQQECGDYYINHINETGGSED
jgi:hypothetical protein